MAMSLFVSFYVQRTLQYSPYIGGRWQANKKKSNKNCIRWCYELKIIFRFDDRTMATLNEEKKNIEKKKLSTQSKNLSAHSILWLVFQC